MIIGIHGKMNSGKDLAAKMIRELTSNFIVEGKSYSIEKFANKLKRDVEEKYPDEFDSMSWEFVRGYRDGIMPSLGITRREALQSIAKEQRDINPDYYVDYLMDQYKADGADGNNIVSYTDPAENNFTLEAEYAYNTNLYPNWIISDVRYKNEWRAIEYRNGLNIKIVREEENAFLQRAENMHDSEQGIGDSYFTYVIQNNGTKEELKEKLKKILIEEEIL